MARRGKVVVWASAVLAAGVVIALCIIILRGREDPWRVRELSSSDPVAQQAAQEWLLQHASMEAIRLLVRGLGTGAATDPRILRVLWGIGARSDESLGEVVRALEGAGYKVAKGQVRAVSPQEKLALVAGGKDQGFTLGLELTVLRGPAIAGQVKVTKVFPDLSGCEIIEPKGDAPDIANGDRVFGASRP